jgi:hypothetical protein
VIVRLRRRHCWVVPAFDLAVSFFVVGALLVGDLLKELTHDSLVHLGVSVVLRTIGQELIDAIITS